MRWYETLVMAGLVGWNVLQGAAIRDLRERLRLAQSSWRQR